MLESLVFVSHLVISAAEIIRRPLLRGSILYFSVFIYYINRQSNIFLSPPLQVLVFDKVVANILFHVSTSRGCYDVIISNSEPGR